MYMYVHTSMLYKAQLMRPGIGRNASCALGDCLTSRPKGRSRPRELWFSNYAKEVLIQNCMYMCVECMYVCLYVCNSM